MTRVAVLQSNYLPWKGYFDIINQVDVFVFYDDVQYTKNDWRNRNRIQTPQGVQWLTVPAGSCLDRRIDEVELADSRWQKKHWRTIEQNYRHAPYFDDYCEYFKQVYLGRTWLSLSELNQALILEIATKFLGVTTQFRNSHEFQLSGRKGDRLLELLQRIPTGTYVSGPSARGYLEIADFRAAGVEVEFLSYADYPEYRQQFTPFEHAVSIIDLLFNCGPDAHEFIWGHRSAEDVSPCRA